MANQEQEQTFVAAKQVSFNLKDIILNTNNKVALLYPKHTNKEYFKCVSDFISKCCLRKPFTKSPNMYQEYLAEFWYSAKALENSKVFFSIPTGGIYGDVRLNTFRNAIGAHYLPHSSKYVASPSIDIVRKWFPTIWYREEVSAKGNLKKSLLPPGWSLVNGINIDYANILWKDLNIKLKNKQREKALKPNQPEEPPFTTHMLAIYNTAKPVVFKAPKTFSKAESVSQGAEPGAQTRHKKAITSSKQPPVSSKEATKGGSSKAPTGSKTGHSRKKKESSSAMDSNPSQPLVSTPVDTKLHKEDQQATGGPTSLGVTSEERANPQLSSGMSAFLNEPIFSASFIIHSESASGHDVSADSIAEADRGLSAPNDYIPPQQSIDERTKTLHMIIYLQEASSTAIHGDKEHVSSTIKLEDLAKLVSQTQPSFKDLDLPKDDHVIIVDESEKDEPNTKTKDTSSQKHKLKLEKNKAEAEAAQLKAQPSFPNVEQLNKLLVKSLQSEFSKMLSAHDFSSSLPSELKDLPSKFAELSEEVASAQAKLKTLDALPSLLLNVTRALDRRADKIAEAEKENLNQQSNPTTPPTTTPINPQIITTTSQMQTPLQSLPRSSSQPEGVHIKKDKGKKVMSSDEAEKESTESESNEKAYVTGSMVESSKTKKLKKFDFVIKDGEHIHLTEEQINHQKKLEEEAKSKEAKAKAAKQEREVRKAELINLLGPEIVHKYYKYKLQYDRYCDLMLNRRAESRIIICDVVTKKGPITLKVYREDGTSEVIPNFKASDPHLGEWREVVKACPNRKEKGWKTIYGQIGTRMDYLHSAKDPLEKLNDLANKKRKHVDDIHDYFKENKRLKSSVQYEDHSPSTVLNKPVLGMILFNSHQRQDFVTIEDFRDFPNTMLDIVQEIFFRLHQGHGLDDHARTFSSLLSAKVDMRNLNPLK
nr:hypothetical protein [Tanacetum cinerariifolium]